MEINFVLNGRPVTAAVRPDTLLIDLVRQKGCLSVKRGCETSNCGLCTVLLDGAPVLSCSVLAARADGHRVDTLEGLQEEARPFAEFIADQGAEQCGFCNPGFVMNTIAQMCIRDRASTVVRALPGRAKRTKKMSRIWMLQRWKGRCCISM